MNTNQILVVCASLYCMVAQGPMPVHTEHNRRNDLLEMMREMRKLETSICPRLCKFERSGEVLANRHCHNSKEECILLGEVTICGEPSAVYGCLELGEPSPDLAALFQCMTHKACNLSMGTSSHQTSPQRASCKHNAPCDFSPLTMVVDREEWTASFCQPPLFSIFDVKSGHGGKKKRGGKPNRLTKHRNSGWSNSVS